MADQVKERFESDSQLTTYAPHKSLKLWLTKLKNDLKAIHNVGSECLTRPSAVADQVKERFESDSQLSNPVVIRYRCCG